MLPVALAVAVLVAAGFVVFPLWARRAAGSPPERLPGVVAALLLVISAGALYAWLGSPDEPSSASVDAGIDTLRSAAEAEPRNAEGWVRLGDAELLRGGLAVAQQAYQRADALAPGEHTGALVGLATVLAQSGDAAAAERALVLFDQVLQREPQQPKALFYSALILMQAGELQRARERLQSMLALDAPDNVKQALQKQIASLDAQLQPAAVDVRAQVRLLVSLAPDLQARLPQNGTLFVFVRNAAGGAPLAVKRLPPAFPVELALSASDAMLAGNAIQPGQSVAIVARVSASNTPTASSGDLFGEAAGTAGQREIITIVIDRLAP